MDMILEDVSEPVKGILESSAFFHSKRKRASRNAEMLFSQRSIVEKTAFDLHIHINTLHYRLKQMKELTDIDPKSVKGITLFTLRCLY
ncbi:helix-turn-helix domain-containing protein [Priestia megaterium]